VERPTRHEQAQAILQLKGARLASRIIGRHARTASDYEEAFNLELVDLISEITTPAALLALGRNVVGPADGLYVLDDGDTYRVYLQDRGDIRSAVSGASFEEARTAAVECILRLGGLPYRPPG
jgi:hypothetical protein